MRDGVGGADWLALLRTHIGRFAAVVATADPDAPVTHCPGWSVRDLVAHLGDVHQWAAHAVTAGTPDLQPTPPAPDEPDLAAWYAERAAHLLDVLASTPSDAPAWTLDAADRTAGFWRRRQVHEVAMHTWDAEEAAGRPTPYDPALAWDGVLEVAEVLYPRQVRLGRVDPLAAAVRLVATDVPGDVTIGSGTEVEVRDRAEVLLRLLWHRADTSVLGPEAAGLLAGAITP
jgi:uncharacterized protein (TIGR03083 family)